MIDVPNTKIKTEILAEKEETGEGEDIDMED